MGSLAQICVAEYTAIWLAFRLLSFYEQRLNTNQISSCCKSQDAFTEYKMKCLSICCQTCQYWQYTALQRQHSVSRNVCVCVPELGLAGAWWSCLAVLLFLLPLPQHPLSQQEVCSCDVVVLIRLQSPEKTDREINLNSKTHTNSHTHKLTHINTQINTKPWPWVKRKWRGWRFNLTWQQLRIYCQLVVNGN